MRWSINLLSVIVQRDSEDSLFLSCNLSDNSEFVCCSTVFSDFYFSHNLWCLWLICVFLHHFFIRVVVDPNRYLYLITSYNMYYCRGLDNWKPNQHIELKSNVNLTLLDLCLFRPYLLLSDLQDEVSCMKFHNFIQF